MTPREQLAAMLKQARLEAGFDSQAKIAKAIHVTRTVIVRAESGSGPVPSDAVLAAWAKVTGRDLADLVELATRVRSGTPEWFVPYLGAEQTATRLRLWEPASVPGLCQTEAYALALEKSEAIVSHRLERQRQVLGRASVVAVIDYLVLHRCIGSPMIMAAQCAHLVELVEAKRILLHVVPEGANVGLGGGVAIASKNGHVTIAMGTRTRDITSTAADVVEEHLTAFDEVLGASLPVVQSVEYARRMEGTWKEQE